MENSKTIQNPFPGLRPFEKDEYHLFFGRENHIETVLQKLNNRKFVCIVGNSGSGKSSLIKAGVLPSLRNDETNKWSICTLRPGSDPINGLFQSLFTDSELLIGNSDKPIPSVDLFGKNIRGMLQAVRPFMSDGRKLLILVDQFEELFRFLEKSNEEEFQLATQFINLLLQSAAEKSVDIHVMMTIRSDFLGDCEQFYGLPEAINDAQFLVPRLNRDELQKIIEAPIEYMGAKITPRLVQQLLNTIGTRTDLLPVLQHLLNRLWNVWIKAENGNFAVPIDIVHYENTGGMELAMSNHLEEVIGEIGENQLDIIEDIFKTLTVKGPDNRGIRRPTKLKVLSEISRVPLEELKEIINQFRRDDRGFIMPPSHVNIDANSTIDISHESLMRVWPRLIEWANQEQESLKLYNRICENALLYDEGKAGLWRNPDLEVALKWQSEPRHSQTWGNLYNTNFQKAKRFLKASKENQEFEEADKKRKKRTFNIFLISSAIVLTTLTIISFIQKAKADRASTEANISKENAKREAINAKKQEKIALDQKKIAEEQKEVAFTQRKIAIKEQENADKQRKLANVQTEIAIKQRRRAESEKQKAQKARQETLIALQSANKANEERKVALEKAISAEQLATQSKNYALAKSIAIKSKLLNPSSEKELKKSLSAEALSIYKNANRPMFDRDLHSALLDANKVNSKPNYVTIGQHEKEGRALCSINQFILSAGLDGKILNYNSQTGALHSSFSINNLPIYKTLWLENKGILLMLLDKNSIYQVNFDAESGNFEASTFKQIYKDAEGIVDFSSVNDALFVGLVSNKLLKIDFFGNTIKQYGSSEVISKIISVKSASKYNIFFGTNKGNVFSINDNLSNPVNILKLTKTSPVSALYFNDGLLYVGSNFGECIEYSIAAEKTQNFYLGHQAGITDFHIDENNKYLATSSFDGIIRVYSLQHKKLPPIAIKEHQSWVFAVKFANNSSQLYSNGRDRKIKTFQIDLGKLSEELQEKKIIPLTEDQKKVYIEN